MPSNPPSLISAGLETMVRRSKMIFPAGCALVNTLSVPCCSTTKLASAVLEFGLAKNKYFTGFDRFVSFASSLNVSGPVAGSPLMAQVAAALKLECRDESTPSRLRQPLTIKINNKEIVVPKKHGPNRACDCFFCMG